MGALPIKYSRSSTNLFNYLFHLILRFKIFTNTCIFLHNLFQCDPYVDPPFSPENLQVVNTDSGCISLKWKPAQEMEKAPIDGYIIEMATGDSKDFIEVATVNGKMCTFDATDLKDGQKYNFRIKACNSSGISNGSTKLDKPVLASSFGKPNQNVI